jgi:predicted GIY-YIG superfamily endonuclease
MIGYIYEITNADRSIVYIGSTTQDVEDRWAGHKSKYNEWLKGKDRCGAMIYHHFKQYGIAAFDIQAIEQHEITSKDQLFEFEQLAIDRTPNTCNKRKAHQSLSTTEYAKQYYATNREKINSKVECQCGGRYTQKNKYVHVKTNRHKEWVASQ